MRRSDELSLGGGAFPRPGPALTAVLAALLGLWIVLALAINWGPEGVAGMAAQIYALGAGSPDALRQLELWRLVTAAVLHEPQGLGSIFFNLLGLYFLGPSLEKTWGSRRFLLFLLGASLASYGLQALALAALPTALGRRLAPDAWLGSMPLVEAIAIAWATSFRGRIVNLFFVLPVSSRGLVLFVVGASVLAVIAAEMPPSGLLSPFGGMLAGWLLGGEPMTLRRLWLTFRLRAHELELAALAAQRRSRAAASGLRVIPGGGEPRPPGSEPDPERGSGGGPRMLH